jgi:hypothetical protein
VGPARVWRAAGQPVNFGSMTTGAGLGFLWAPALGVSAVEWLLQAGE